ncbi:tyrosine-type recombinase/integrase [Clostridium subterminale]|uniref:Tyrosine-type recombinase/integrase n=1 Tax=Clostridium subterminale TaxID=1550 RepID=A0ABN1KRR6_CLOSU
MIENSINLLGYKNTEEYTTSIINKLSKYHNKIINDDGTVKYIKIKTDYFLVNDIWNLEFFNFIEQFKSVKSNCKIIKFDCKLKNVNNEFKLVFYNKIFSDEWTLKTAIYTQNPSMKLLNEFINTYYPNVISFLDVDITKAEFKWIDWLEKRNIKTTRLQRNKTTEGTYSIKSYTTKFLRNMYEWIYLYTDEREEWGKDKWDVRVLNKYGINFVKSMSNYYIDFTCIDNIFFRKIVKDYFKKRLLSKRNFSWNTAHSYISCLSKFVNFISVKESQWVDFIKLDRQHIESYIEYINIESCKITHKNANHKSNVNKNIKIVQKFLSDIQLSEDNCAPQKNIRLLIHPDDKPKMPKKPYDQIDYVPDHVLEQLFDNITNLNKEIIPVVYTMFKTGLRISDVLGLKQDCLIKLNNKFWIETDIEKTYVEGHRIPIDDELANMLAVLIVNAKQYSNQDNNPENYIFVRYKGSRKGKPYSQAWIQNNLNLFAIDFNITDELGNRYYFKNHSFRHTYAIKMLNGGTDILTVQELLAHASPEMTMRYAKLLDSTKRKVFDKVVKQGIFSFNESDRLREENNGEIPSDIIDMLYTNHKLNALDTPYGTCMQRKNGKCSYAKQPPCLTCNNGNPCKDLCVGAFEGDSVKYEILINSTKTMIENAKMYNRTEMVSENEELLKLYEDIYSKISQGNMIYSRLDKLKKKVE